MTSELYEWIWIAASRRSCFGATTSTASASSASRRSCRRWPTRAATRPTTRTSPVLTKTTRPVRPFLFDYSFSFIHFPHSVVSDLLSLLPSVVASLCWFDFTFVPILKRKYFSWYLTWYLLFWNFSGTISFFGLIYFCL